MGSSNFRPASSSLLSGKTSHELQGFREERWGPSISQEIWWAVANHLETLQISTLAKLFDILCKIGVVSCFWSAFRSHICICICLVVSIIFTMLSDILDCLAGNFIYPLEGHYRVWNRGPKRQNCLNLFECHSNVKHLSFIFASFGRTVTRLKLCSRWPSLGLFGLPPSPSAPPPSPLSLPPSPFPPSPPPSAPSPPPP